MHLLLLALLWIAWCGLHSLLISPRAHMAAEKMLGRNSGAYRLIYVFFSIISLMPILWFQFTLSETVLLPTTLPVRLIQLFLLAYGLFMFYAGARVYDMGYFLGLKQLGRTDGKRADQLPFHTNGVLAYVRHPWYSGGIAFIWGFGTITDVFLVTRAVLTCYLIIGTLLEEKRLMAELGKGYRNYQKNVPMLFPRKPKNKRGTETS